MPLYQCSLRHSRTMYRLALLVVLIEVAWFAKANDCSIPPLVLAIGKIIPNPELYPNSLTDVT